MEKFEIKKFKDCNINDPFFDSLKSDYRNFVDWYNQHPEREVYVQQEKGNINALLIIKDDEQDEITLKDKVLPRIPRIKICTLKLNENVRDQRLGEGTIGIALWHWQKRPEKEVYVTVFPKQEKLIGLLTRFGFIDCGEYKNGEHLLLKSKDNLDKSSPYTFFPFINISSEKFGILPIEDKYHDILFPYSELKNSQMHESNLAVSNGVTKIFIATPYKEVSYIENEPIFVYRKFDGPNKGYKSVLTSFCTITKIHNIKINGKYLQTYNEFLKVIKNKSVYSEEELSNIYKNSGSNNILVIEMLYNGYFGEGNNINWWYLKNNGYLPDGVYMYNLVLNKKQFLDLLRIGGNNEKDIIID